MPCIVGYNCSIYDGCCGVCVLDSVAYGVVCVVCVVSLRIGFVTLLLMIEHVLCIACSACPVGVANHVHVVV